MKRVAIAKLKLKIGEIFDTVEREFRNGVERQFT
jgi:hypothetical protein